MISWAKFEGKLFSDPKRSGPFLEKVPLNSTQPRANKNNICYTIRYIKVVRYPLKPPKPISAELTLSYMDVSGGSTKKIPKYKGPIVYYVLGGGGGGF